MRLAKLNTEIQRWEEAEVPSDMEEQAEQCKVKLTQKAARTVEKLEKLRRVIRCDTTDEEAEDEKENETEKMDEDEKPTEEAKTEEMTEEKAEEQMEIEIK